MKHTILKIRKLFYTIPLVTDKELILPFTKPMLVICIKDKEIILPFTTPMLVICFKAKILVRKIKAKKKTPDA